MRVTIILLFLVSLVALAAAQSAPIRGRLAVQPKKKVKVAPKPAAPKAVSALPVGLKPLVLTMPEAFGPVLAHFTTQLLEVAQTKLPELDVKRAERGLSRLVAAFSFLHLVPFDRFTGLKNLSLEKVILLLGTAKNFLTQFLKSQQSASTPAQKTLSESINRIARVLELLREKLQQVQKDSVVQDQILRDQLSSDGRRLKSVDSPMN